MTVNIFSDPLFTPREVSTFLEIPRSTVYHWLNVGSRGGAPLVHHVPAERRGAASVPFAALIEAFVLRAPEENREQVYGYLLQRNARMYAVAWAIDATGDVYLSGRVPLASVSPEELDRILGCVLEYADGTFNTLLEMGFGSSIRREWAWRVKRGESLANLQAFKGFAERTSE